MPDEQERQGEVGQARAAGAVGRRCPDGGYCHHDCLTGGAGCSRVAHCAPLGGGTWGEIWAANPEWVETVRDGFHIRVKQARAAQVRKYSSEHDAAHGTGDWVALLCERLAKVCRVAGGADTGLALEELAAVAMAWAEARARTDTLAERGMEDVP